MLFFCYIESWSCHYFRVTYNEARGIWCFVFYAAKTLPHPAASGTHGCVCVWGSPVTQSASYLVMLSSLRVLLMRAPKMGGNGFGGSGEKESGNKVLRREKCMRGRKSACVWEKKKYPVKDWRCFICECVQVRVLVCECVKHTFPSPCWEMRP